jgi:hypothetical protein
MEVAAAVGDSLAEAADTVPMKERKAKISRRFITRNSPKIMALAELICTGDKSTFTDYEALIGPVLTE